jgi:hypothetical protein
MKYNLFTVRRLAAPSNKPWRRRKAPSLGEASYLGGRLANFDFYERVMCDENRISSHVDL